MKLNLPTAIQGGITHSIQLQPGSVIRTITGQIPIFQPLKTINYEIYLVGSN